MSIQNIDSSNLTVSGQNISGGIVTSRTVHASSATVETKSPASDEISPPAELLQHAIEKINLVLQQKNRALEFSVDTESNRIIVKVIDTETGDLIRQLPSETTLAISRRISESQQGLLLKALA